jgi:phosphomannomutase
MHKLYFLGKKVWVYYRKSFENITKNQSENGKNYEIPAFRVSQEVTNIDELPMPNPLPNEALTQIRNYIALKDPSLNMFGIDIIQDSVTKVYYIIDINFAPSYAEVPNGPSLLLNHLLSGTVQRTNRPHNNTVFLPESRHSAFSRDTTIVVFDIDGTLTENGRVITEEVKETLQKLRQITTVGVISGGTLDQVGYRLGPNFMQEYDYVFAENSCQTYHQAKVVDPYDMESILTRKELMELINWALVYIANLDLPLKRGNFIDYRNSLINISPAGRWISEDTSAREEWIAFDRKHGIRKKMVDDMKSKFGHWNKLSWVIGGNSGFDVFPRGWDKSLVHRFTAKYEHYYYFGDRTDPALFGNDWLCFSHPTSFGFSVKDPEDTINIVKKCFCLF